MTVVRSRASKTHGMSQFEFRRYPLPILPFSSDVELDLKGGKQGGTNAHQFVSWAIINMFAVKLMSVKSLMPHIFLLHCLDAQCCKIIVGQLGATSLAKFSKLTKYVQTKGIIRCKLTATAFSLLINSDELSPPGPHHGDLSGFRLFINQLTFHQDIKVKHNGGDIRTAASLPGLVDTATILGCERFFLRGFWHCTRWSAKAQNRGQIERIVIVHRKD